VNPRDGTARRPDDPIERLLGRTRRRLTLTTLGLIALLVAAIGISTAIVGLRVLDSEVDRALNAFAVATVNRLDGELPSKGGGAGSDEGGSGPAIEAGPAESDTFVLVLDAKGKVVSNPSQVSLTGLPDQAAVESAAKNGSDVRDVEADGVPIRLETLPVEHDGTTVGYVQVGFVLTLHDQQSARLVFTIAIVGLVGLLGAAIVAVIVTGRALVPIRRTMAGQRRFVADASHELRTPATLIRSAAEILERERLVSDEGRPFVEDIEAEADRLARLVEDLLTLASTDAGVLKVDRHPIDLAEVARDTVRRATSMAEERRVRLTVGSTGTTRIEGDRDRLVQLLLILVDNASAHSPDGGTVTVSVDGSARRVVLSVADEGPGVPEEERERVFEPFHRLRDERRTEGGTGLGLAIARRLAQSHGAAIEVDDAPGGGARFRVTFVAT
jgi:two-component system sensor histidine kinase CiaH